MRRLLIIFCIIFCLNHFMQAQQSTAQLDSMMKVLAGEKDDTNKVKTLSRISQYYYTVNPLQSFPYANQALALAEKIQWKKGISNLHNNLGLFICDTGNNELGRKHYEISYQLNIELGAKTNQVNNLNNIGRSYMVQADYTKAVTYFYKALPIAEELKDHDLISLVAGNILNCYLEQKDYAKARQYADLEMEHGKAVNNTRRIIHALLTLGTLGAAANDTPSAISHTEQALKIAEETNNKRDEVNSLINLATYDARNYKRQIELLERAGKILDETNPSSQPAMLNNADLGEAYILAAEHSTGAEKNAYIQKGEAHLMRAKALGEKMHAVALLASVEKIFVHLEEVKGNYKEALIYYKKLTATSDSLFSQEKKNEIAGIEGKHNLAVKDNELALNKLTLANQRKMQWGLIAGLVLLVIIGALLSWQSRSRKKANTTLVVLNNRLDEANKVKARFFSILSHDLRSPIVNLVHFLHLQKDNPDLLSEEQQATHRQKISDSAEGLLNNMEAMLLWSKEQMENFKPNITTIQVADLFEYIQNFFGQTGKVNMVFSTPPDLTVISDENYLRTIMQNLTSNAIRALRDTANASIEWAAKKEGDKTILSIADNGPGIAPEQVKVLFDDSVANNAKNGLGLHLIRDLAKAIQYKIAVQSEPGTKTIFVLSPVNA